MDDSRSRKSSRKCEIHMCLVCLIIIHWRAPDTLSKIAQLEEAPKGREESCGNHLISSNYLYFNGNFEFV